jgi:long-chain fatty acid transport protein
MRQFVLPVVIVMSVLIQSTAWGAGLWLYEMGSPDLGTAAAGRAALASDASTVAANPAGMTRLNRSQMLAAFQGIYVNTRFDTEKATFGGGDGGNAGGFVPSGSLHYVHSLTPDWRLGISAGSYFGLGLDYEDDWAGRYYATEAELLTFGVNPGVGYRVNDWLSVGAGFTILYANLTQKAAVRNAFDPVADGRLELDDDDTGYGFNLGVLVEPRPGTRLGLTYRSQVDLEFNDLASLKNIGPILQGLLNLTGLAGSKVDLEMDIPQAVMLSAYHQITDLWAVMGNIGWQDWSAFGKSDLTLRSSTSRTFTRDLEYDDTWHFALGSQYRFSPKWLWSVGAAYDTSPIDDDENRTPDLALDRQIRVGTGFQYDWDEDVTVGLAYTYLDAGKAEIDQEGGPLRGTLEGDYDTNAIHVFAVNLIWKF